MALGTVQEKAMPKIGPGMPPIPLNVSRFCEYAMKCWNYCEWIERPRRNEIKVIGLCSLWEAERVARGVALCDHQAFSSRRGSRSFLQRPAIVIPVSPEGGDSFFGQRWPKSDRLMPSHPVFLSSISKDALRAWCSDVSGMASRLAVKCVVRPDVECPHRVYGRSRGDCCQIQIKALTLDSGAVFSSLNLPFRFIKRRLGWASNAKGGHPLFSEAEMAFIRAASDLYEERGEQILAPHPGFMDRDRP